jgi:hypothetical protein
LGALVAISPLAACSDDQLNEESTATMPPKDRPAGPSARFSGPLEGGDGIWLASSGVGPSLADVGYSEAEYAASGTATSYAAVGELAPDGAWELEPTGETGDYSTRVIVRRPEDPAAFNGAVALEWLNVSSGTDSAPDYTYLADELVRGGYAWVGVSAQHIAIEGGDIAVEVPEARARGLGQGLRARDPERYGDLHHPGDAFAYDIFTQVSRAVRDADGLDPLDGLDVERVLAVGESQSAFTLTTYVNGVQPLTEQLDGFLIHSRGKSAAALGEAGKGLDVVSAIVGPPTTIRTDGEAPLLVVETETDTLGVFGHVEARQPDSRRYRLWEIAGAAHSDRFQVGAYEEALGCPQPINRGQQVFVLRAALRHLDRWVRDGDAPPEAPRLEVDQNGAVPAFVKDAVGNVRGGVRSPVVDAPVDVLSGFVEQDAPIVCLLMGSTTPLTDEQLAERYRSSDDYLAQYEAATTAMIDAGFALEDDRAQILDGADPGRL